MKTIIVATDFSATATNAAKYAVDLGFTVKANILLLHVYQVPVVYQEIPLAMTEVSIRENAHEQMAAFKHELVASARGEISIDTDVRIGQFFSELDAVCQDIRPYAVVMGCQGSTEVEHLLFGSHAVHAMKNLNWPLITVPREVSFSSIKKIGLACDFDHVMDVLPVNDIKRMIQDFGAQLHILNTARQDEYNPDIVYLSGMLTRMFSPVVPQFHFISSTNIDDGIIYFAEESNIDLLIVVPKPHGLLYKLIHKSHTKQLVLHSHVPVMALHHYTF